MTAAGLADTTGLLDGSECDGDGDGACAEGAPAAQAAAATTARAAKTPVRFMPTNQTVQLNSVLRSSMA
jgi:hypothetical protein